MKKIMFNDKYGLTQAVLEGRKTQTRRLIKPQPEYNEHKGIVWKGFMYGIKGFNAPYDAYDNFISPLIEFNRLPYNVGEEVAIAQKYADNATLFPHSIFGKEAGWDNKMFVKAEYMPHRIKITNVRVERLQDISDEDCLKEGIQRGEFLNTWDEYYFEHGQNYITAKTARDAFKKLIDKVSGKGTWGSNPYVFVYDFKLIK